MFQEQIEGKDKNNIAFADNASGDITITITTTIMLHY